MSNSDYDYTQDRNGRPYVFPLVHLNGTGKENLQAYYKKAHKALSEAASAFLDIDFHARDYYPLGDDAWMEASRQHREMCAHFNALQHYLEAHRASLHGTL